MKTLIIKSIMLVIIIVALGHYALYLKTGQLPWVNWQGPAISLPSWPLSTEHTNSILPSSKTKIYTWVDEQGVLNYSQESPPANLASKEIEVDGNINLMQATPLPKPSNADTPTGRRSLLLGDGSPSDDARSPIEKAEDARALLEAREQEMKKILDTL